MNSDQLQKCHRTARVVRFVFSFLETYNHESPLCLPLAHSLIQLPLFAISKCLFSSFLSFHFSFPLSSGVLCKELYPKRMIPISQFSLLDIRYGTVKFYLLQFQGLPEILLKIHFSKVFNLFSASAFCIFPKTV